jgi:hypothetical protein
MPFMTKRKQLHNFKFKFIGDDLYYKYKHLNEFHYLWDKLDDRLWPIYASIHGFIENEISL